MINQNDYRLVLINTKTTINRSQPITIYNILWSLVVKKKRNFFCVCLSSAQDDAWAQVWRLRAER